MTPGNVACQSSLSIEFSRQEYWSGQLFLSLGDHSYPGIEPGFPALQADSLPSEPQGSSMWYYITFIYFLINYSIFYFYFFHLFYQLEANYFTTLQWFLLYIDRNQPWICMCSPSRYPPNLPILLLKESSSGIKKKWIKYFLFKIADF